MKQTIAVPDYGWNSAKASGSASYLYPPIVQYVQDHRPRAILDLGCGNGHLATVLAGLGQRIVAVDADEAGIVLAKAASPGIDFRCLNVGDCPPADFVAEPFDCIISTEVVEHLFFPGQLFDFAKRVLAPGGVFLVSTPYHGWLKNTAIGLLGRWDAHHQPAHEGGHIKFWSRRTLGQAAGRAGFREVSFTGCGRIPFLWKSMLVAYAHP